MQQYNTFLIFNSAPNTNLKCKDVLRFLYICIYILGCLSKLLLNSGASWVHTAEITPVKTAGSVSTVWMVQYVSVKQASKETGMSNMSSKP